MMRSSVQLTVWALFLGVFLPLFLVEVCESVQNTLGTYATSAGSIGITGMRFLLA